jgi:hypothetical protein
MAGPGQKLHELEVELPGRLATPREIQSFHETVARRLRSGKRSGKQRRKKRR